MIEIEKLIEELEDYLEARNVKKIFIKRGKLIPIALVVRLQDLILDYGRTEVFECIEKCKHSVPSDNPFVVEVPCYECQTYRVIKLSKTKLLELITDKLNTTCESCLYKQEETKLIKKEETKQNVEKILTNNTKYYIENYLDPNKSWVEGMSIYQKILKLKYSDVYWDEIEEEIKQLDYQDFLQTPYWKAITVKKMKDAKFRCQLCDNQGKLYTHHRNYKIHGKEIHNMNDLIVLCQGCHEKHHDIYIDTTS